jgi:hypothetical protein
MFTFVQNKVLQLSSSATALGIAVIFSYCFFIIEFFPSELSLGETLLFLFAGLGFGIFYSIIIGIFYVSIAHVISVVKSKNYFSDLLTSFLVICFLIIPLIVFIVVDATIASWQALISFYASGFILNIETIVKDKQSLFITGDIKQEEEEQKKRKILILIIGILTPIFMSKLTSSNLLKSTFTHLGIRAENATLLINDSNQEALKNLSESQQIPIFSCQSNQYSTLQNITVDWHGIGSTTQIRLNSKKNKELIIPLDSNGVKVIKGSANSMKPRCFLLKKNIYFNSGNLEPNEIGNNDLDKLLAEIKEINKDKTLALKEVYLTGYTDIQPVVKKDFNNYELSKKRIEAVKFKLTDQLDKSVEFKLAPSSIYNKNQTKLPFCSETQYKKYERSCLSYNRLVEVTVKFEIIE